MEFFFSERLLNPFRGTLSVVQTGEAEALSTDGLTWTLFVLGTSEPVLMDDGSLREARLPDVRYGTWSATTGLRRAPVRNTVDYAALDAIGARLLEVVKSRLDELPFPLRDRDELWLLDGREGLPLALLDSSTGEDGVPAVPTHPQWRCGERAQTGFRSPHAELLRRAEENDAEVLTQVVHELAGEPLRAQWFRRDRAGGGRADEQGDQVVAGRQLRRCAFPERLLRTDLAGRLQRLLLEDYLRWLAPSLLTLQDLRWSTRHALEEQARGQAFEVSRRHRLYPEVVDPEGLAASLVEARLRRAIGEGNDSAPIQAELYPFFNE